MKDGQVPELDTTTPTEPEETTPSDSDKTEDTTTGAVDTGTVFNCNTLRIRANAGTEYAQVGTLARGDKVSITDYTVV